MTWATYIKAIAVDSNGDKYCMHLGLSNSALPRRLWHESDDLYGFYARQTTRNWIVLYVSPSNGHRSSLRVVEIIMGGNMAQSLSHWPLGLDCAFVQVSHENWVADGVGNFLFKCLYVSES